MILPFCSDTFIISCLLILPFIICSLALTIISRADLTPTESVLDIIEEKSGDTPLIPENN